VTVFFLSMCFAAVYLDHHWVFDVLVGITYCLVSYAFVASRFAKGEPEAKAVMPQLGGTPLGETQEKTP
jgi:membrane-associated phospholipid phosphatase